jgi:hypothetical protein
MISIRDKEATMSNDPRPIGEKLADIDRQAHGTTPPERGMGESSERAKKQNERKPPMADRDRNNQEPARPSRDR